MAPLEHLALLEEVCSTVLAGAKIVSAPFGVDANTVPTIIPDVIVSARAKGATREQIMNFLRLLSEARILFLPYFNWLTQLY
jgi:hypothetical protein